jgi:hypothetical protein
MTKDELIALLRLCNADPSAIDVAELAYELGYKAGQMDGPTPQPKEEATNDTRND